MQKFKSVNTQINFRLVDIIFLIITNPFAEERNIVYDICFVLLSNHNSIYFYVYYNYYYYYESKMMFKFCTIFSIVLS